MNTDREKLIEAFRGLRVADVCDAMDAVGLLDRGLVAGTIRPLFRDTESFVHRIAGPALTVRYVPTNRQVPNIPPEHFDEYVSDWYRTVTAGPWEERIRKGDILVFDASDTDVGVIGSNNCLGWVNRGAVGVVTNGGARDTDELIKQRCPVYARYVSRSFMPGRVEFDTWDVPVNCGGVLVRPGDMIVADGDGVIVVPAEKGLAVAGIARGILAGDKRGRRRLYEAGGRSPDSTVTD